MDQKFWHLKNCTLFERLTTSEVARIEVRSKALEFRRGKLVYLPDEPSESVLLLVSGRVKLYHVTGDGKQALLAFVEPGELFGELALFHDDNREEFAEAMENSLVVCIPRDEIQRLMAAHADVSIGVTKLFGLRTRRIERRLKSLLFRSNRDRLIHLLLELAERYGRATPEGVALGIKLSHQDLACIIGSTRETVTVLLGDLQSENSLTIRRRQIVLTDVDRLADAIGEAPPVLPDPLRRDERFQAQARMSSGH